jgi:hypothetical protein
LGERFVEGVGPLGRQNSRRIGLEAELPVAVLGPDYIRLPRGPGGLHMLPFPLSARVCCRAVLREVRAPPSLDPPPQHLSHASDVAGDF